MRIRLRTVARPARAALLAGMLLAACASTPEAASLARKDDLGTAPITHVVLVQLKDPTRVAELIADCDRALPGIEGVDGYSCGVPLDMGRANVTKDYDVGIYVGFATPEAYRAYVDHPRHLALVERWRDGWKAVRIFDVVAGAPSAALSEPAASAPATAPASPTPPATTVPATPPNPAPAPAVPPPVAAPSASPTPAPAAAPRA